MNIKKFLIISCITLQISTLLHASVDQAAYNTAFVAFYKALNTAAKATDTIAQTAIFIYSPSNKKHFTWSSMKEISDKLGTPQAQAVAMSLSQGQETQAFLNHFPNADSKANLQVALAGAASNTTAIGTITTVVTPPVVTPPVVTPPVVTPPVVTPPVVTPPTPTAKQTAANTLQQQIEAAKTLFNQYVPGTYSATTIIASTSLPA